MKALSGYAEWFWLMAKGWKTIENRPRSLPKSMELPARIYLHASKTKTPVDEIDFIRDTLHDLHPVWLDEFMKVDWSKYRGRIIGEATITGQMYGSMPNIIIDRGSIADIDSPWYFGKFGYGIAFPKLYANPVFYPGQLGFFEIYSGGQHA
jgi:hypothetical protein